MRTSIFLACWFWVSGSVALSLDDARHLLSRTGFSPAPHEIESIILLDREEAVDAILNNARVDPVTPVPIIIKNQFYARKPISLDVDSGCTYPTQEHSSSVELFERRKSENYAMKRWWWTEILNTGSPITEHMTLFWHDHFATRFTNWAIPQFKNNQLLRSQSLGNFKILALSILKDPAMLYYLNNEKNIKGSPNENLAREFFELFTLGEGNYSENDIKEFSKVLAGHGITKDSCEYFFTKENSDISEVTLFGKTGVFSIEEAVGIVFDQKKVAEFITKKFWVEFISTDYSKEQIDALAHVFRKSNYDIKSLLRAVLLHNEFWNKENRARLVKSPVELLAGMVRSFGIWLPDPDLLILDAAVLGQDLFMPDSVEGWPSNDGWVNPRTVVLRAMAMDRLMNFYRNSVEIERNSIARKGGLVLEVSSFNYTNQNKLHFELYINNKFFKNISLNLSETEYKRETVGLGEQPEVFYIPAKSLPPNVKNVTIKFSPPKGEARSSALFVHWVEHKGIRYNSYAAEPILYGKNNMAASEPVGMMFENSALVFDLGAIRKEYLVPSLSQSNFMAYNLDTPNIASLLTHGNEEVWEIRPAAKVASSTPFSPWEIYKSIKADDGDNQNANESLELAILPMLSTIDSSHLSNMEALVQLTRTPLYQLK